MKNTIILILSILVIGLGSYVIFDKVGNSNKTKQENNIVDKKDNNDNIPSNPSSISVSDAVNYKEGYFQLLNVKLPKIIGTSSTIEKINNSILNEIIPKTYFFDVCQEDVEGCIDSNSKVDYNYIIKNNVLAIEIYSSGIKAPATNSGNFTANYFYDISNDQQLSLKDAANKMDAEIEYVEGPVYDHMNISNNEIKVYIHQ